MNNTYIQLREVDLVYGSARGPVQALDGVSLDVERDTFVSILGPSGCGKSTLLKVVGGLLAPTRGLLEVDGADVQEALHRKLFGFVFQESALLAWRNVMGNITLLMEVTGQYGRAERERRAHDLLHMVGLADFADRLPKELSGGMRQRVAIARALSLDAPILLMDEPFGALDAITRDRMNVDLINLWQRYRKTVLFVTHNIFESIFLSDRVIVMSARPARMIEDLPIDLPRPRTLDIQEDPRFIAYARRLRKLLEG